MEAFLHTIYTIGHGTRSAEQLIALLKQNHIDLLIDVRSFPRSRRNPQFNAEVFSQTLKDVGIQYMRIENLGGYRRKRDVPKEINGFWRHPSFHNYADYALSESFDEGLSELIKLSKQHHICYMCSETVWWRCHRRIITDYLLMHHIHVEHIMSETSVTKAKMTDGAEIVGHKIHYPAAQKELSV